MGMFSMCLSLGRLTLACSHVRYASIKPDRPDFQDRCNPATMYASFRRLVQESVDTTRVHPMGETQRASASSTVQPAAVATQDSMPKAAGMRPMASDSQLSLASKQRPEPTVSPPSIAAPAFSAKTPNLPPFDVRSDVDSRLPERKLASFGSLGGGAERNRSAVSQAASFMEDDGLLGERRPLSRKQQKQMEDAAAEAEEEAELARAAPSFGYHNGTRSAPGQNAQSSMPNRSASSRPQQSHHHMNNNGAVPMDADEVEHDQSAAGSSAMPGFMTGTRSFLLSRDRKQTVFYVRATECFAIISGGDKLQLDLMKKRSGAVGGAQQQQPVRLLHPARVLTVPLMFLLS